MIVVGKRRRNGMELTESLQITNLIFIAVIFIALAYKLDKIEDKIGKLKEK